MAKCAVAIVINLPFETSGGELSALELEPSLQVMFLDVSPANV